ncbi:MAG: alpha/beta fold hydrolase [Cyclobacteriaceae bacterium]
MILNYRKYGKGEPLIILHGVFGSSDNWQTLGKQFAEHFEVYLIDQRNHGNSFHHDKFNYQVMADDLLALINKEGLKIVNLLGHSMGGKTVMHFACHFPNLVDKLIVVDITPKNYPPHHQKIFEAFHAVNLQEIKTRGEADQQMSTVISDFGTKLFLLKNLKRTSDGFSWKVNLPVIEKNILEVGRGLEENDVFNGETLFIGGGASDYITNDDHPLIRKHFPKAKIEMIAGAGHWVHAVKPKELYESVENFLKH